MSKIGKKTIVLPKESSIKIDGANLTITGPKGSKTLTINDKIFFLKFDEGITTEFKARICPFLILENMSPIGSVNVIFLLPA